MSRNWWVFNIDRLIKDYTMANYTAVMDQFLNHYYGTFDQNRAAIANLYVSQARLILYNWLLIIMYITMCACYIRYFSLRLLFQPGLDGDPQSDLAHPFACTCKRQPRARGWDMLAIYIQRFNHWTAARSCYKVTTDDSSQNMICKIMQSAFNGRLYGGMILAIASASTCPCLAMQPKLDGVGSWFTM